MTTNTDEFVLNTGTNITPASLEAYFDSFRTSVGTEFTSAGFTAPVGPFVLGYGLKTTRPLCIDNLDDRRCLYLLVPQMFRVANANFGATGVYSYMYQFMSGTR